VSEDAQDRGWPEIRSARSAVAAPLAESSVRYRYRYQSFNGYDEDELLSAWCQKVSNVVVERAAGSGRMVV